MMQLLQLTKKILATSIFLPSLVWADIGNVFEQIGEGNIKRDDNAAMSAVVGSTILLYDTLLTDNGRIAVSFNDDSNLRLTEHSKVLIDEVIYDPNPSKSKMVMKFAMGTARFTSGKLGLMNKANIDIQTPTASIGIRGTDFTTTIDELGRSLVILLPNADGSSSGIITVANEGGIVTLDQAYQATMVSTISTAPAPPVTITNITVGMIDNMFIVNPPAEVQQQIDEQQTENNSNNILTADFLEFNDLETDYLDENQLEYTELDRDLLDVDFLQDLLEIIEEADLLSRRKSGGDFGSVDIRGTLPGFDKDTQYQTIVEDTGQIWFYRQVTGIISIRLAEGANARINTITDEKESLITVGDGESINIIIRQTN